MPQHVVCSLPPLLVLFLTLLALFPVHHSLPLGEIVFSAGTSTFAAGSHASQAAPDPLSASALASKDLKLGTSSAHNAPPPKLVHTTPTPGSSGSSTHSTVSHGSSDTFSPSWSSAASNHDEGAGSKSPKSFSPSPASGEQQRLATQPLGSHSSQETTAARGLNDAGLIAHQPVVEKPNTYISLLQSFWNRLGEYNPMGYFKPIRLELHWDDSKKLIIFLKRIGHQLNAQDARVLNEYYKALSAANKKSTAMVRFNPETFQLLSEWENARANSITRQIFRDFFDQILPHREVERRIRIYHLQRDQFRILSGWDAGITSMAKQTPGLSEEEVRTFGEALGGKKFVPPLDKTRATERLNALKDLEQKAPQVAESWRNYMGTEYDSRVKLLETLSQMEHSLEGIYLIEGWRAQGLDVKRMLRIIDYRPKQVQPVVLPDGQERLRFLNLNEIAYARKLFFSKTRDGIPWVKSLEHKELVFFTSPEIGQRYLDLAPKLKNAEIAPPHVEPPKDPEPIPTPATTPTSQSTPPRIPSVGKPGLRSYLPLPAASRLFRGLLASTQKQLAKVFSKFLSLKWPRSSPISVVK